jgi:hypothetical protein
MKQKLPELLKNSCYDYINFRLTRVINRQILPHIPRSNAYNMGNCLKEPVITEFEVRPGPAVDSETSSACPDFRLSKATSQAATPALEFAELKAASPASLFPSQGETELSRSLDNLAKQLNQSREWQEGMRHTAKFSHVMAETRLLEAKIEKLQRHSLDPAQLPSHKAGKEDYLALEKELERHMDVILEDMSDLKEDVADLTSHVEVLKTSPLPVRRQLSSN